MPAAQLLHTPPEADQVPAGQLVHDGDPAVEDVPAKQLLQELAPADEYVPEMH